MKRIDIWFVVGVLLVLLGILMFIGVVKAAPTYSNVGQNLTYVGMNGSIELRAKWTPGPNPYEVSEGVYVDYLDVSSQDSDPSCIAFNDDGTKLYILGGAHDCVYEYNLSTPYDISTGVYNDCLNISDLGKYTRCIAFNDDGTKLYVVYNDPEDYPDKVYEYNLTTPWDVSTGVYNDYVDITQDSSIWGIAFNNNGTKLYIVGGEYDQVYEYNLTTPWDVSTRVYVDSLDIGDQDIQPKDIEFNNDGTKMYMSGQWNKMVYEYELSTPYDVSTGTYVDSLNTSSLGIPYGIAFNDNGTKFYVAILISGKVYEYNLTARLDSAILYVNITGSYQAVDTIDLNDSLTAKWSNFSYTPTTCNKVVGWKITANDSSGTSNTTPIGTFYVMPYLYSTSDSSIISSIASCSSKHNATITPIGSGDVNLTLYMPYIVRNATFKECNYEVTEDADLVKIVPSTYYCVVNVTNLEAESGTSFYVRESTGLKAFPPSNLPAAVASAGLVIIIIYTIATRKRS